MKQHVHYILAVLFYLAVAQIGGSFTADGVRSWYPTIAKPGYTPPGFVIGIVWTGIYILAAASLIMFTDAARGKHAFWPIIVLYALNGIINAAWSYVFFAQHALGPAVLHAGLIGVSVAAIMRAVWPYSRAASLLLLPYLAWVTFATFLSYQIYRLN